MLINGLGHSTATKGEKLSRLPTVWPRNSWFHRYEPVIEKAFARLWGERPKEDEA